MALRRIIARRPAGPPQAGQSLILVVALGFLLVAGTVVLAAFGKGLLGKGRYQRSADLAALSAARTMKEDFNRLFIPPLGPDGAPDSMHMEKDEYLQRARQAAVKYASANDAALSMKDVSFPDEESLAPISVKVKVRDRVDIATAPGARGGRSTIKVASAATAELSPVGLYGSGMEGMASGGGYNGPLAYRQGRPMRPDVALAFDRMYAAAQSTGIHLIINSAYRSDAEQAILFQRHPDPKWVAPPGKSLHRLGTELDLGPTSAYGWLAANAGRFGFIKRYSWEPWHFGYTHNPRSTPDNYRDAGRPGGAGGESRSAMPSFVPARYAPMISKAAQRYNVSAALLAAQLYAESNFNPNSVSSAGAQGIAQFMPETARSYGLKNPFDAQASINAQARFMRELLMRFASVSLALAAYNAGPGAVAGCGCVPAYPETQAYVAKILALMGGAGDIATPEFEVKLVS